MTSKHDEAYRVFGEGRLREAVERFEALAAESNEAHLHYMLGLAHKYSRNWRHSLRHNLRSLELQDAHDESSSWNAAIAATALGDWDEARRQWIACGITLPGKAGPILGNFGTACVRLNPWGSGETLYADRIDPVRSRLTNVPFPSSGYQFGDIVLNDGAQTGERSYGERKYMVFNSLQLLERSEFETYAVFVGCESEGDRDALRDATLPGVGLTEDWTESIRNLCLRCSYSVAHLSSGAHDAKASEWQTDRHLGIAAQSRVSVERLLDQWLAGGDGRRLDAIEHRQYPLPEPDESWAWWKEPEEKSTLPESEPVADPAANHSGKSFMARLLSRLWGN